MEELKKHGKASFSGGSVHFLKKRQQLEAVNALLRDGRFFLLLVRNGEMEIQIAGEEGILLKAKELILVSAHLICSITGIRKRTFAAVLTFTKEFVYGSLIRRPIPMLYLSHTMEGYTKMGLTNKAARLLLVLSAFLDIKINSGTKQETNKEMLKLGFYILTWELTALLRQHHGTPIKINNRKHVLVLLFLGILNAHYKECHRVQFYAKKLHITADYLSKTLKEVTGMTAKGFIKALLVNEAKALLQGPMEVNTISRTLGFRSPYDFSTFFRVHSSLSPTAYRQNLYS